jgi:hypothetical protein
LQALQEKEGGGHDADVEVALDAPPAGARDLPEAPRPFLLPSAADTRVATRQVATGSAEKRRQASADLATVAYNAVNEPWLKYDASCVADRGYGTGQFVIARFQRDVLYLETDGCAAAVLVQPRLCFMPLADLKICLKLLDGGHV